MKELSREAIDSLINKYIAKFSLIEDGNDYTFMMFVNAPGNLTGWSNTNDIYDQKWMLINTVEASFAEKETDLYFHFSNQKDSFLFPASQVSEQFWISGILFYNRLIFRLNFL